jgi:hypothetical protein
MDYKLHTPPPAVGYWVMPGSVSAVTTIKFTAFKRPRWLTRKMMYYVFEWKWEDAK